MKRPVVFSIAGSDPGGGAGIQQDLKVLSVLGVFGCAAVTALTVQNTRGVKAVYPVSGSLLKEQVQAVMEDIRPPVVKTGMLSTRENVQALVDILAEYSDVFVVADPVMLSKNGRSLLEDDALTVYMERFFPLIDLITPNIPECARFTGLSPSDPQFFEKAPLKLYSLMTTARLLEKKDPAVLLKGGHDTHAQICTDVLYAQGRFHVFESQRLFNRHTHGTGCTLSSAVAAFIARGNSMIDAVEKARHLVYQAIKSGFALGSGTGPVDPLVVLEKEQGEK